MKKKALCTASFFISTKFCRFNAEPTEKSLRLYKVCGIENNVFLHTFTHAFFTLRFEVVLEVDKDIAEIFVKEVDAPFAPLFHPGVKWGQRYVVTHLSHL